jgi:hypothetical protein
MLRPIGYAMHNVAGAARHAAIPGPATTSKLQTKAGEVKLRIPKLRTQTFENGHYGTIETWRIRPQNDRDCYITVTTWKGPQVISGDIMKHASGGDALRHLSFELMIIRF